MVNPQGNREPLKQVRNVAEILNNEMTLSELRPDYFA